jgi:hypothetical protein
MTEIRLKHSIIVGLFVCTRRVGVGSGGAIGANRGAACGSEDGEVEDELEQEKEEKMVNDACQTKIPRLEKALIVKLSSSYK